MQILIIARSNGMDARGWSVQYRRARQLRVDEWHLGMCLLLSHFIPAPIFDPPMPHALKTHVRAHAHTHTITYTDQWRAQRQGRIVHPARRERDHVRFTDATAKSARGLPVHLLAPRAEGVDRHRCALRHGARARARHVRDGDEGNTGEWSAVKIIHT